MGLAKLIVPLGILTYLCLITTLLGGIMKAPIKYHKMGGIITATLATLHAGLIIYLKFFAG